MSSVTIKNVTKSFGSAVVLDNFDAVFADGEFITLLGPSGCGKTTMLRIIAGFEKPTSGAVLFDDRVVSSEKVFIPPEKRDIGMVFQSYAVWPHMTVFDNVAYPLQIKKVDKATIKKKVDRVLEVVHLTQYRDRIPSQLSGGQQQRVALARALVAEPALLLLDEPLSNLDARLRLEMREEIRRIQLQTQVTTIFVTHDQEEAMSISDHIVLMKDGVMQQFDQPQVLYDDPANQFVADFLGNPPINNIPGTVKGGVFITEDGKASVALPMLEKVPDGTKVNLSVRSESFTVQPDGAPGTLQCQVTGVFKTGKEEMAAFLFGGVPFRAYIDLEEGLQKGQTVSLGLKKRGVFVFDRETGRRYV